MTQKTETAAPYQLSLIHILILDISPRTLERVLYFASYIVLDKGETDLQYKQILSEAEYQEEKEKWGSKAFRVGMGAEAIQELLQSIDLEKEYAELQAGLVKMCIRDRKYIEAAKLIERGNLYEKAEAVALVKKSAVAKFDETIEAHIRTGCDGRLSLIHISMLWYPR